MPDTTPVYALPFPESSDPPDGPSQFEALALAVEEILADRATKSAIKNADTNRASTIAPSNDPDLTVTLRPNVRYRVVAEIGATGATGGDIRVCWGTTGTIATVANRRVIGPAVATTDSAATSVRAQTGWALTTNVQYGCDGVAAGLIQESFIVDGGASGGVLTLQWAQGTSSGTNTTVKSNSSLVASPI